MKNIEFTLNSIALTKLSSAVVLTDAIRPVVHETDVHVMTVNQEFMRLGYIMDEALYKKVNSLSIMEMEQFYNNVIPVLKAMKGDDVVHKPMYPNFPKQVIEMSHLENLFNQIVHYWSNGTMLPSYKKECRKFGLENVRYKKIGLCTREDVLGVFTRLLMSTDSIKDSDKRLIEYFIVNYGDELKYPDVIPYKENVCIVAGMFIEKGKKIDGLVKNATDVLRIATYLSGGDVSLADKTNFKKFSRPVRRILVKALENVIKEEDIKRHKAKWVLLAHRLHVGDYSKRVYDIMSKPRNNVRLYSVAGTVIDELTAGNIKSAIMLLKTRPGDYARKLDELLRKYSEYSDAIVYYFSEVAEKVSTRVLLQVYSHFLNRKAPKSIRHRARVIFPKGSVQSARILPKYSGKIDDYVIDNIIDVIDTELLKRFAKLGEMGKVYIDERLKKCPLPTQLRSASDSVNTVARGTRIPFGDDKNIIRFFIHWVGRDIDLSATMHDESFTMIQRCAYTNRKVDEYGTYHSGDITYAPGPDGASEFIDISIDKARNAGARYIVMNVLVYSGPNFCEHDECSAGWMTRSKPNSNEIFDPKTVEGKFDLISASRNAIPIVIDLVEREVIWCDLITPANIWHNTSRGWHGYSGNNVENNKASITQVLKAIAYTVKFNLYDLFLLHAEARKAELVTDVDDADIVFDMFNGINPTNTDIINSEYVI